MNLTPDDDAPDCTKCRSSKTANNLDLHARREYKCLENGHDFGEKKSQM